MDGESRKEVSIKGETFSVDQERGILKFHIREPFFSAGKQFHWFGATIGLGISKDALQFALQNKLHEIQVTVGESQRIYKTTTVQWLNFANENNSKMMRGTTEIYVCQWAKPYFVRVQQ